MNVRVDHLVYGAPDLDAAVDLLEGTLGVRATEGGLHPGRGTRNALIALGPASYLESSGPTERSRRRPGKGVTGSGLESVLGSGLESVLQDRLFRVNVRVDHLVYAAPDLDVAVDLLERTMGVRATEGGSHPGRGTRNAVISLGSASYLEIIGPDRTQPAPSGPRWFSIDELRQPRLVRWAAAARDLEATAAAARLASLELGDILSGGRRRADGKLLSWRFTDPSVVAGDGLVPFFIDWGGSPHPAEGAAAGVTLRGLRAEHPDPARIAAILRACGVDLEVGPGDEPALVATLKTPRGSVALR